MKINPLSGLTVLKLAVDNVLGFGLGSCETEDDEYDLPLGSCMFGKLAKETTCVRVRKKKSSQRDVSRLSQDLWAMSS